MDGPIRIMELMDTDFNYPIVPPEYSLGQAWRAMGAHSRNGNCGSHNSENLVLVINHENQLEGVINFEILSRSMDSGVYNMAARVPGGGLINGADYIAYLLPDRRVEEVMLPVDKIALKSTDPVNKAFYILLNNDVDTLPVLNIFRHVIGIIHAADVFHVLGLGSSYCKLAFVGYDYPRHGTIGTDVMNNREQLPNLLFEKKLKLRVRFLQKFNPKAAIIAAMVGLMLSQVFYGRDTNNAGMMAIAFNNMVIKLQDKTVKLPSDIRETSAYRQEMTGLPN